MDNFDTEDALSDKYWEKRTDIAFRLQFYEIKLQIINNFLEYLILTQMDLLVKRNLDG